MAISFSGDVYHNNKTINLRSQPLYVGVNPSPTIELLNNNNNAMKTFSQSKSPNAKRSTSDWHWPETLKSRVTVMYGHLQNLIRSWKMAEEKGSCFRWWPHDQITLQQSNWAGISLALLLMMHSWNWCEERKRSVHISWKFINWVDIFRNPLYIKQQIRQ